jgi:hypothetical protein
MPDANYSVVASGDNAASGSGSIVIGGQALGGAPSSGSCNIFAIVGTGGGSLLDTTHIYVSFFR